MTVVNKQNCICSPWFSQDQLDLHASHIAHLTPEGDSIFTTQSSARTAHTILKVAMAPTLYKKIVREDKNYQRNFRLFLAATVSKASPVSVLRGQTTILTEIRSLLKPDEGHVSYKVKMDICSGTEHCFAEALEGCGGWMSLFNQPRHIIDDEEGLSRESSGSLSNVTMSAQCDFRHGCMDKAFVRKNVDGSYWSEMQLREFFHDYSEDSCHHRTCGGSCGALPGDTVFWRFDDCYRNFTRFEPATEDELLERGWLQPDGSGFLSRFALDFRQGPNMQDD
jgi:hypothetical protein